MTNRFRHLWARRHLCLVFMLVLASIVPATLHASALSATIVVDNGHHVAHQAPAVERATMNHHHQAKGGHDPAAHEPMPSNHGDTQDNCCPMSCSYALCSITPPIEAVIIHDSFEIELILGFVVAAITMPERPPRA